MTIKRTTAKARRAARVRSKIFGTTTTPRLSVYRSSQHLFAQLIDDVKHVTLVGLSTKGLEQKGTKTELAQILGKTIAAAAAKLKINQAVFDRRHFRYHGRIKTLADSAREGGLKI